MLPQYTGPALGSPIAAVPQPTGGAAGGYRSPADTAGHYYREEPRVAMLSFQATAAPVTPNVANVQQAHELHWQTCAATAGGR